MKLDIKKTLLIGTAIVAVGGFSPIAKAATEIDDTDTIVADDATGLVQSDDGAATAVTIDSDAEADGLTLGANATPSLVQNDAGQTLTVSVTTSGDANGVIFADNITETAGDIVLNITNDNATFQGTVGAIDLNAGSGGANPTITLTFDTANAENITFGGTIDAVDAGDTVNLVLQNTNTGARTMGFTGDIGTTAIDAITIGADDEAMAVTFGGSVGATTITIGAAAGGATTNAVTFGTTGSTDSTTANIVIADNTDDTNTITGLGTYTFSGTVGSSSALVDAIQLGADSANSATTFADSVYATTLTIGAGANGDTNSVTFGATGETSTVGITTIAGGHTADTVGITVAGGSTVTFTGNISTLVDTITIGADASNTTATFEGTIASGAMTIGAGAGTADTNVVTIGSDSADITLGGAITSGNAADDNTLNFVGGNVITTGGAIGTTAIDEITIAADTTLAAAHAVTATDITLVADSTLRTTAGITITGDINGAGTLDVNAATTVAGSIGGTTALDTITVAEGIALNISAAGANESVDAGTILLEDDDAAGADDASNSSLTLTPGANTLTIESDITSGDDSTSTISIANGTGTVAFQGDIGTSTVALRSLTVGGGGNNAVTTTGNMYIDTISLDDTDSLTFLGTTTQTVSGEIRGVGAGDGAIVVGNGTTINPTVTFGLIGSGATIGTLDVLEGSTGILSDDATTATDFTIDGTLRINQGVVAASADVGDGTATDGTLEFVLGTAANGDSENGRLNLTNIDFADFNGGASILTPTIVTGTGIITDGQEFLIMQESGGDSDVANATAATEVDLTDNSALYNFRLVTGENAEIDDETVAAEELFVIADRVEATSVTSISNNVSAINAIFSVTSTSDQDLLDVIASVNNASASEVDEVVESIAPTVDGGAVTAALDVSGTSLGLNDTRLASLRTGGETGMSAGQTRSGMGWWAQAFGQTASQDRRDSVDGFDADTYGVAVGLDSANIRDNAVLGVAFSYANSDVDSKNANNAETDVDSYQVSLYGDYDLDSATYVSGSISYAWNDVSTTRYNVGAVTGLTAKGDYDADQFGARAEVGRDYAWNGATVTPSLLANWVHYSPDSYTETGAGGANLSVDGDSLNVLDLGVGVDMGWELQQADGAVVEPSVHAGYRYDVIGDEIETTSSFTGGGAAFSTQGADPAQSKFNVGAGISYAATNNWKFTANYDFEYKEDYDAHAGYIRAGYKF